jgi:hypothetical protein
MIIPMNESATATANAAGSATVRLTPGVAGATWIIKRVITNIDTANTSSVIKLDLYRNSVSETNRLDGTSSAAQDTSETEIPFQTTDVLIGVYTGAPVGSHCTVTISGTKDTGRR